MEGSPPDPSPKGPSGSGMQLPLHTHPFCDSPQSSVRLLEFQQTLLCFFRRRKRLGLEKWGCGSGLASWRKRTKQDVLPLPVSNRHAAGPGVPAGRARVGGGRNGAVGPKGGQRSPRPAAGAPGAGHSRCSCTQQLGTGEVPCPCRAVTHTLPCSLKPCGPSAVPSEVTGHAGLTRPATVWEGFP